MGEEPSCERQGRYDRTMPWGDHGTRATLHGMSPRRVAPCLLAAVLASLAACGRPASVARPRTVAGTLRYSGGWSHVGPRAATDEWLVYSFEARDGDRIAAYVRSSSGSPAVRLVDEGQRALADGTIGHPDGDTIAVATCTASRTGTYYLLLRDTADPGATLDVQLGGSFACHTDADCERAGEATGDPAAPSPLDVVPVCLHTGAGTMGSCKGMLRH
jgi:hypothetical protein